MVKPTDVSKGGEWELVTVIIDGNGKLDRDSLALCKWQGQYCLGTRWDSRNEEGDKGFPSTFGHPNWYILPKWMEMPLLCAVANQVEAELFKGVLSKLNERETK